MSFNSRTREGCDSFKFSTPKGGHVVSIHAPGRGATEDIFLSVRSPRCFNSRTREGCDPTASRWTTTDWSFNSRTREGCDSEAVTSCPTCRGFQFTHPGGVRLCLPWPSPYKAPSFNSRTREGCDVGLWRRSASSTSFNSRTREGCDVDGERCRSVGEVSIHAPGRGATREGIRRSQARQVSIHAPGRGATWLCFQEPPR